MNVPQAMRRSGRSACATIVLLLVAQGGAGPAGAAVYTDGCGSPAACTVQELLVGGSITAGGQRFDALAIEVDPGTVDWTRVVVTGQDDTGFSPGPGLRFEHASELKTEGTDCLDLQFSYRVTPVIPSWQPVGNDLVLESKFVVGNARIEVDETLFAGTRAALGDKTVRSDDGFGDSRDFDQIGFEPQADGLLVSNTITIEGDQAGDQAALDAYLQRFALTQVPEPGFAALATTGSGALAWIGTRRTRRRHANRDPRSLRAKARPARL